VYLDVTIGLTPRLSEVPGDALRHGADVGGVELLEGRGWDGQVVVSAAAVVVLRVVQGTH